MIIFITKHFIGTRLFTILIHPSIFIFKINIRFRNQNDFWMTLYSWICLRLCFGRNVQRWRIDLVPFCRGEGKREGNEYQKKNLIIIILCPYTISYMTLPPRPSPYNIYYMSMLSTKTTLNLRLLHRPLYGHPLHGQQGLFGRRTVVDHGGRRRGVRGRSFRRPYVPVVVVLHWSHARARANGHLVHIVTRVPADRVTG